MEPATPRNNLELAFSQTNVISQATASSAGVTPIGSLQAESVPIRPVEQAGQAELAEGATVAIGEAVCKITAPLGMGSFGVVWAAECLGIQAEVAVKEILCQSQTDLARAVYEAQLLWMLGATSEARGSERSGSSTTRGPLRIPAYVASDMSQTGEMEVCRVRLAMDRIPGDPLDRYLRDRRQQLDVDLASCGDELVPDTILQQVLEAYSFARELLLQLSPTMERIATLAYHRDVNAHNILVSMDDESMPQYGLVDFGLAVDAAGWRGGDKADAMGTGDWQHLDVGGDCRYWPASAWLQFEVGCYDLAKATSLCLEYQTHLDLQGLGITALQVLTELMPKLMPNSAKGLTIAGAGAEGPGRMVPSEFWQLGIAWDEYWEAATHFWTALLETFRNNGDWNVLKNEFIAIGVHEVLARKLENLRAALAEAEEACRRMPPSSSLHEAEALFASLLVLISCGEERPATTQWDEVLAPFKRRKPTSVTTLAPSTGSFELSVASTPATAAGGLAPSSIQGERLQGTSADPSYWLPPPTQVPKVTSFEHRPAPAIMAQPLVASPPQSPGRQVHRMSSRGAGSPRVTTVTRGASPSPSPMVGSPQSPGSISPRRVVNRVAGVAEVRVASPVTIGRPEPRPASPATAFRHAETASPKDAHFLATPVMQLRTASPVGSPRAVTQVGDVPLSPRATGSTSKIEVDAPLTPDFKPGGESRDLFLRLSNLASKVVQLANAMETLEHRDRDLAAAAARRSASPGGSAGGVNRVSQGAVAAG